MIFFFYGPNTFAARQQIAKLAEQYIKKTGSDLGLERIDGTRTTPAELKSAVSAMPFLATSRLVVIEDLSSNKSTAAKIADITEAVPDSTVVVFYDPGVDQRTSYFKHLRTKAKAVKFEPLSTRELQQWVAAEAKRQGGQIEGPAILRLLELAGEDQWRLRGELGKLANYRSQISIETLNQLVEPNQNESVFELVDALASGRASAALEYYHKLLQAQAAELYILSMITWQLRNLLLAKTSGLRNSSDLAKQTGMSPYVASKALNTSRNLDETHLKQAFVAAVETEYRIKSGQGKSEVLVEQLIIKTAEAVSNRLRRPVD
jgi:DNA polymerase-3 subunit delta